MGRAKPRFPDHSLAPTKLEISAGDWKRIEKAYGHPLPSSLRRRIVDATEVLKFKAIFARNQRIVDVEKRIRRIQKGAKALQVELRGEGGAQLSPSHWFGDLCIESQFEPQFTNGRANEHMNIVMLIKLMECLDAACIGELNYLDRTSRNTPSEGCVWAMWVATLTGILRENGLPTTARKDSDKQKEVSVPAFVALVRELQRSLPQEYRPAFHSNGALA